MQVVLNNLATFNAGKTRMDEHPHMNAAKPKMGDGDHPDHFAATRKMALNANNCCGKLA